MDRVLSTDRVVPVLVKHDPLIGLQVPPTPAPLPSGW
jgi:hypothetical protein